MSYRTSVTMWFLAAVLLMTPLAEAQMPGMPMLSKADMLSQAKQMVTDLTSMKSGGKLTGDQAGKVDTLLPKATSLTSELEKPQIETSKLGQLAKDLGDLQKQVGALKSMVK